MNEKIDPGQYGIPSISANSDFVSNVFNWGITIAGLVAVGFVIMGGINYVISRGDPNRTKKALMTILYSVVGVVIVILAKAITYFVSGNVTDDGGILPAIVVDVLNVVIGVVAVVSVVMIVVGGIWFATSQGDPNKTKRARDTVLYSLIGLVVAILSFAIINFVAGAI